MTTSGGQHSHANRLTSFTVDEETNERSVTNARQEKREDTQGRGQQDKAIVEPQQESREEGEEVAMYEYTAILPKGSTNY